MTLSAPPEPSLRAPLDRPRDPPSRRVALIAGVLFVITFVASIPAVVLYAPLLNHANYILGAGADTRVFVGALLEVILVVAGIGTAVVLYPVVRRQSESIALGYVACRIVESAVIAVGIVSVLSLVHLRQDFAGVAGKDTASLLIAGKSLVEVHEWTFLLGPAFCAGIGNGMLLGYLMYKSGLVPRRMALLGVIGGPLAVLAAILALFGAFEQTSGAAGIVTLPEILWEASLGIYLIVKGFKPSPILYDDGRHTGVDGPLIPVIAAPVAAAPVVAAP